MCLTKKKEEKEKYYCSISSNKKRLEENELANKSNKK
jgi:hypothetical protein